MEDFKKYMKAYKYIKKKISEIKVEVTKITPNKKSLKNLQNIRKDCVHRKYRFPITIWRLYQ